MKKRELSNKEYVEKANLIEEFIHNNFDKSELDGIAKIVINITKLNACSKPQLIHLEIFDEN